MQKRDKSSAQAESDSPSSLPSAPVPISSFDSDILQKKYFYAETESDKPLFDLSNGKLKDGVALRELSASPFKLGNLNKQAQPQIEQRVLPEKVPNFYVDGNYALDIGGKHEFESLEIADAYVKISGTVQAQVVIAGLSMMRALIAKHKDPEAKQPASLIIDGPTGSKASSFGHLMLSDSFLDVKTALHVGPGLPNELVPGNVLVVKGSPNSERWRMQGAELEMGTAELSAKDTIVEKDARLMLRKSVLFTNLQLKNRSVTLLIGENQLHGNLESKEDSFLLLDKVAAPETGIRLAKLSVDGLADVSCKMSVHHGYGTLDAAAEREHRAKYEKYFEKYNEFPIVKAKKLMGRASLLTQSQMRTALQDTSGWEGYFQKFVTDAGKKFALQHDYNENILWLKIVDKNTVVDSHGCLADIGKE